MKNIISTKDRPGKDQAYDLSSSQLKHNLHGNINIA